MKQFFDFKNNKKGTTLDIATALFSIVVLVISLFMGHLFIREVRNAGSVLNETAESRFILDKTNSYFENVADGLVIFLWVGLVIAAIGSALITQTSKIFFAVNIVVMMLLIVLSVGVQYWIDAFVSLDNFSPITVFYPKTLFFVQHIELMTLVAMVLVGIALWGGNKRTPEFG